jgi:hypothetical protein
MKKLLTAAFTALAITNPAQAYVSDANAAITKSIIQKLRDTGVTIVAPKTCPQGLAGKFQPSTAVLMICPAAMASDEMFVETIAHESIHVAQNCVSGLLGQTVPEASRQIWMDGIDAGMAGKWSFVDRATADLSPRQRAAEIEAYAFENSPKAVLTILGKACR